MGKKKDDDTDWVAVYDKELDEFCYSENMKIAEIFINDPARNPKRFKIIKLTSEQVDSVDLYYLQDKEIILVYDAEYTLYRAMTAAEARDYENLYEQFFQMQLEANKSIDYICNVKFSKDEKAVVYTALHQLRDFVSHILDYDTYCESVEEDCFGWAKYFNFNAVCTNIIEYYEGREK